MNFLGIDLFLSHGLYGTRPRTHLDAYRKDAGWYALEAGSWSLDVTIEKPGAAAALKAAVVAALTFLAVYWTLTQEPSAAPLITHLQPMKG